LEKKKGKRKRVASHFAGIGHSLLCSWPVVGPASAFEDVVGDDSQWRSLLVVGEDRSRRGESSGDRNAELSS
jgi:hypothetical protein